MQDPDAQRRRNFEAIGTLFFGMETSNEVSWAVQVDLSRDLILVQLGKDPTRPKVTLELNLQGGRDLIGDLTRAVGMLA